MTWQSFFPVMQMGLSLAASAVYCATNDRARALYWLAGSVITFCVTFLIRK